MLYTSEQIHQLLVLVDQLYTNATANAGSDHEVARVDFRLLTRANIEVQRIKRIDQTLTIGVHHHKDGSTAYPFLAPKESPVDEAAFIKYLGSDYQSAKEDLVHLKETPVVTLHAQGEGEDEAPDSVDGKKDMKRALVTMRGGAIASIEHDEGLEVAIFDFDSFKKQPTLFKKLPSEFSALARAAAVPATAVLQSENEPAEFSLVG